MLVNNIVRYAAHQYEDQYDAFWKAYTLMKNCVFEDNFEDTVGYMIDVTFKNVEDRTEIRKRILTTVNLLRQWVDAVSRVYDEGAVRSFRRGNEVDTVAVDIYSRIKDLDRMMIEINQRTNLHNTIICYVRYNDDRKEFYLEWFDRESCDVKYSHSIQDIKEFRFQRMYQGEEFIDVFWSEQVHRAKKSDGTSTLSGNQLEVNPYNTIPAIPIRKYLGRDFWSTSRGHGLLSATMDVSFQNTIQAFTRLYNNFKIIAITAGKIGSQTTVGANKVLQIEIDKTDQVPGVQVLDMGIDFQIMQDTLEKFSRLSLQSYGLNDVSVTQPDNSGRAIEMRDKGTIRMIRAQIPIFREFEKSLFNLIRKIWNAHNQGEQISEETVLNVTFGVISSISGMDDLNFDIQKMKNGLLKPVSFFTKYNPDVDPDDAENLLAENVQKYKEIFGVAGIAGTFQPGQGF